MTRHYAARNLDLNEDLSYSLTKKNRLAAQYVVKQAFRRVTATLEPA